MCGIVGYVGREQAAPILIEGLKRLEYRGYDSAGVSVHTEAGLQVSKSVGRLQVLCDLLDGGKALDSTIGIGHTRWATHGKPSDINSHPHTSACGKVAVVHNGIIENYREIKEMLEQEGIRCATETDTEVVAHLIAHFYDGSNLLDAVYRTIAQVEGSYALGILFQDYPDRIVAARKDNPLILAQGDSGNFITSDITAVLRHSRDAIYLEDGEIAIITEDTVEVLDSMRRPVTKEITHIDWALDAAEKDGYEHFMFKEMLEQPEVFRKTVSPRIVDGAIDLGEISLTEEYLKGLHKICIIACGSAYHVGVAAKYNIEKFVRIPVECALASEFRYSDPLVDEKTLVLVVSQSGETADTLAAMREAMRRGAKTLSIVNVVGSAIAKEADDVIYTWAGPEISVATTKAYSAQLAVTYLLTIHLARLLGRMDDVTYRTLIDEMGRIPDKIQAILDQKETLQQAASRYFNNTSIFFIGRNMDYALCMEGSLKLKEISYIHSEAYAAGELKHGTISLIEDGTLVVALATVDALFEKMMSNVEEVRARGASVFCLSHEKNVDKVNYLADSTFCLPETCDMFLPSLMAVPLQLFSYYVALMRGCDIDKPRNLAKSVTVE